MINRLLYSLIAIPFCMNIFTDCMLTTQTPKISNISKALEPESQMLLKTVPIFKTNSFKHIGSRVDAPLNYKRVISSLRKLKKIDTNEDELKAGMTLLALSPENVQKNVVRFLLPKNEDARHFYLNGGSVRDVVTKYGNAEHCIGNKKFKFTKGLCPDHFLPLSTTELNTWRMLHDHFKDKKSGPHSITINPDQYCSIEKLPSEMKENFHNKDSFFTAKIDKTFEQKCKSIAIKTLGYGVAGSLFGTGLSYAAECGKQLIESAQEVITTAAEETVSGKLLDSEYQKEVARKSLTEASLDFQDGFNDKFIEIYQNPDNMSMDVSEALIHAGLKGSKQVASKSADKIYDIITADLSDAIPEACKKAVVEQLPKIISEMPASSLGNLQTGIQYGAPLGAAYGLLSGIWSEVVKNKPLVKKQISTI